MAHENEGPNTIFAGESNPNATRNTLWGFLIVSFIAAPIVVLTTIITYFTFSLGRISYKVISAFVGIYAALLLITGQLIPSFYAYVNSWTTTATSIMNSEQISIGNVIMKMLWEQAPISILIGGVVGTLYSAWRYFRKPSWVEMNFRLSPYQFFMKKKNIRDIQNDKNGPADGRTLGINELGEKIIQTEREAAAHTFVVGAAGAGKTTTLLLGARDSIRRGESYVFVDMKGSSDVPPALAEYAERYNRPFYHWTSQDPREAYTGPSKTGCAYYDPLGRGDATRRTDLLLAGRQWSEDHYKIIIQDYLQRAFDISLGSPPPPHTDAIADIMSLLDPMELKKRSLHVVGDPYYDNIIAEINYITEKKIDTQVAGSLDGMRRQLGILRDSIQGRWLRKDPAGKNDIVLFDVAHAGAVVVFTIDSGNYKNNAQLIGNLIIQDLMTVAGELRKNPSRYPLNITIDEFSAIGTDNIIGLISRSRDAGIPVTLATQSLGDLKAVSTEFMEQLTGIVVSIMIHRANRFEDAENFAGLIGKEKKQVFRQGVEHTSGILGTMSKGSGTGKGTLETVEDYKISPAQIQELAPGEMYYVCKAPSRLEKVFVITEDSKIAAKNSNPDNKPASSYKSSSHEPSSLIPTGDKDKYLVDPSINQKPGTTYANDDFETEFHVEPVVKRADPEKLSAILGRKSIQDLEAPKEFTLDKSSQTIPAKDVWDSTRENPFADEYPVDFKETYSETNPTKVVSKPMLTESKPVQPNISLPPLRKVAPRSDLNTLSALPKIEKVSKPNGTKPIRPRREGDIALPVIFPTSKTVQKPELFKVKPTAEETTTYAIDDWDDL